MPNLDDQLGAELEQWRGDGLYRTLRTIDSAQGARVRLDGREFLNFSSNDYLGLANDPVLKRAATTALEQFGMGAGASRLVCGNLQPYAELERKLAAFKGKEAALVFGSGYAANVGAITALVGESDVVILDKLDHASIIDGARQSGATVRVYPHKNLKKLEDILKQTVGAASSPRPGAALNRGGDAAPTRRQTPRTLIITETVFSMDGDLAPLAEIVALKEKYDAWLMIDEAHATGLYARNRRGLAEAAGVENRIDVTLGTLSKALGCSGGFVVGSQTLIDYLRNRARSLIYSTALPPAVVAAAAAAVEFVMSEEGHQRRDKLWRNVSEMKNGLSQLGIQNESRSPIIPIIIGEENAAVEISRKLYDRNIFVPAIRFPTVPKGKARLRVTVTAGHSREDIEQCVSVFKSLVGAASPPRPGAVSNRGGDAAPTTKHQSNLRVGRVSIAEDCFFVTTCVANRRPIFSNPDAAAIPIKSLQWLRDQNRVRLLGFVVMPDHVHTAFALREGWDLAEVMQAFKSFTGHELRKQFPNEEIWQPGYYDHRLRSRHEFEERLAYIHDNPVRKGLEKYAHEYRFSTAHPDYQKDIDWHWLQGIEPESGRGGDAAPTGGSNVVVGAASPPRPGATQNRAGDTAPTSKDEHAR